MTLIVALDPPPTIDPVNWCLRVIKETQHAVDGYKIGLPLVIKAGFNGLREIAESMDEHLLKIADLKLADIGYVMSISARLMVEAGYNIIIAHGFIGREGGLDELKSLIDDLGAKLAIVASMSHEGSKSYIDVHLHEIVKEALNLGAWGIIAPATRPEAIKTVRTLAPRSIILSPGVGAQGANPGEALCAGADHEIVGRMITGSSSPRAAVVRVKKMQHNSLKRCKSL